MRRLLIIALVSITFPARAAERPIVAVFDMEDRGSGLDKQVLVNLTDYLASLLAEGGYQVVPRDQIRERLKEQKTESYKECYDQSCQIELGRELAAQKSLDISILKIGNKCQMTANLYDLKKATTELAANADADCNEESLLGAIRTIAKKLCLPLQGADESVRMSDDAKQILEEQAREKAEDAREEAERLRRSRNLVHPLTLENMRLITGFEYYQSVFFGDMKWPPESTTEKSYIAGASLFTFDFCLESFSLGVALSLGFSEPDYSYDFKGANIAVGNPTLNFKYRWCSEGEWSFCFGTSTALSAGFFEWTYNGDDPDDVNEIMEQAAHEAAQIGLQDPTYNCYQRLAFRPLAVITMTHGDLFSEFQIGFLFNTPIVNTSSWDSFGAMLNYGLGAGYRVSNWFVPVTEFTGWTVLAGGEIETFLWLNLGARLEFGSTLPLLQVTIPMTDGAKAGSAVQFQVGVADEF